MGEKNLRLDYSVECENCGTVEDIPTSFSETKAQTALHDQGWRLIDDENRCPTCAKGKSND
jgi:hypothetical protein